MVELKYTNNTWEDPDTKMRNYIKTNLQKRRVSREASQNYLWKFFYECRIDVKWKYFLQASLAKDQAPVDDSVIELPAEKADAGGTIEIGDEGASQSDNDDVVEVLESESQKEESQEALEVGFVSTLHRIFFLVNSLIIRFFFFDPYKLWHLI